MKTVLVLSEVKYWRDLREGLANSGVGFLGFDKKKPNRAEIDQLVAKADFVAMRNSNVAHHSVRFAKEACKLTGTPFWINHNFGLETLLTRLSVTFPEENFQKKPTSNKTKDKVQQAKKEMKNPLQESAKRKETQTYLTGKRKNLPLKKALSSIKIDEDPDIDFAKLFKK